MRALKPEDWPERCTVGTGVHLFIPWEMTSERKMGADQCLYCPATRPGREVGVDGAEG